TPGNYRVVVTGNNGCSDTSEVYNHTPSSIDESALFSNMKLYPNPASDVINLEISQLKGKATLELTGVDGRLVITKSLSATHDQLSIAKLPSGIYFIKITTEESTVVRKIVKE